MPDTDPPAPTATTGDEAGLPAFAVLLRRMNSEFNRIAQDFARAQGLHVTDVQALIEILDAEGAAEGAGDAEAGPMTPGALRRRLGLTSPAMTACLDRLERSGHVRRVRSAADRRVVHLHYAEAGKKVARHYFKPLARSTDAARARFAEDELLVVLRFLTAMNEELRRERHPGR